MKRLLAVIGAVLVLAGPALADSSQRPSTPAPVVVRASNGFHWGDAAIGAAAGAGAVIAAMGALVLARAKEKDAQ